MCKVFKIKKQKMKKRYVITYTFFFTTGYLRSSMFVWKDKTIKLSSRQEAIDFAAKFRFKWVANLYCKILQWSCDINYELKDFKVIQIS